MLSARPLMPFFKAGLGSGISSTTREMLGRMLSSTVSSPLIWAVTFMTKPTGTELRVVV